jgi:hypothetical protein
MERSASREKTMKAYFHFMCILQQWISLIAAGGVRLDALLLRAS